MRIAIRNPHLLRLLGYYPSDPGAKMYVSMTAWMWVQVCWLRLTDKRARFRRRTHRATAR